MKNFQKVKTDFYIYATDDDQYDGNDDTMMKAMTMMIKMTKMKLKMKIKLMMLTMTMTVIMTMHMAENFEFLQGHTKFW